MSRVPPSSSLTFRPHYLLKNAHLQTIYAPLFRSQINLPFDVEKFELSDGDFVDCYWLNKPNSDEKKPIAVLFHGLEGSYQSPYIQGAMQNLTRQGYACVLMHFRGCSGRANRLPRSYHSGDTADAKAFLAHLVTHFPKSPLFAVGYSLGGNMLLKLLGEYGQKSPLQAAVAVSAPMQLDISADTIHQGSSRVYERHLLASLKHNLLKKYQLHNLSDLLGKTAQQIRKIKTIRQFDDVYTSVINGFTDAQDYYLKSSAKQYLPEVQTHTLIIHALDDPFMTPEVLPTNMAIPSCVELDIYPNGGHVGFVMGSPVRPSYYLDDKVPEFFNRYWL